MTGRNAQNAVEKIERVIEWQGYASGSGDGWCGKSSGNTI